MNEKLRLIPCSECGQPMETDRPDTDGLYLVCPRCFKAQMQKELPKMDRSEYYKTIPDQPQNPNVTIDIDLRAMDEAPVSYTGRAVLGAVLGVNAGGDKDAIVSILAGQVCAPDICKMMTAMIAPLSKTMSRQDLMMIHMIVGNEIRKAIDSKPESAAEELLRKMFGSIVDDLLGGKK